MKKRKNHSPDIKAKVALEAIRKEMTLSELPKKYGVHLEPAGHAVNMIRSFFIEQWIGFLPGKGPALSNMVAYAQAKSSSCWLV